VGASGVAVRELCNTGHVLAAFLAGGTLRGQLPHAADTGAARAHLEWMRLEGAAPSTRYARWRALARTAAALYPVSLLAATETDLAGWRASLVTGEDAVAHEVMHARCFYAFCVAQGMRGDNPAAGLPVPKVPRRLPRPIAWDELAAAVCSARRRVRPWLVLAAWCGLRAKEIALLRREVILDTARPPVLLVAYGATKGPGRTGGAAVRVRAGRITRMRDACLRFCIPPA
jgi:integrase